VTRRSSVGEGGFESPLFKKAVEHARPRQNKGIRESLAKDPEAGNGLAKYDLTWAQVNLAVIDGTLPEVAPGFATREPDGGVTLKGAGGNWAKRRHVKLGVRRPRRRRRK
jgi:hypothetical protein